MRRESNFKLANAFDLALEPDKSCLVETEFFSVDNADVMAYASAKVEGCIGDVEKAIALYYAVRDEIPYDPYHCLLTNEQFHAKQVLADRRGFCIPKALLLATLARCVGIPSLIGFADVVNHLSTPKMRELCQNELYFHGYAVLYVEGQWLKLSPAFNLSMCEKFDSRPLEFDGKSDALLHEYDMKNRRHMQYLTDYGAVADLPYDKVTDELWFRFPELMDFLKTQQANSFNEELQKLTK